MEGKGIVGNITKRSIKSINMTGGHRGPRLSPITACEGSTSAFQNNLVVKLMGSRPCGPRGLTALDLHVHLRVQRDSLKFTLVQ